MTAVAVLLAGFPHYHCRCPDGRLKLLCFGWAIGKDCCCAGPCCPAPSRAAPVKPAKKACCCCHAHPGPDGNDADSHPRVASPGCQKTVVPADFVAVAVTPKVALDGPAAGPFLLPPSLPLPLLTSDAGRPVFTWESYRAPPPTNLVIALQHFVI
jgi:hypothetical protein